MKIIGYSYSRFSSQNQSRGTSIERQVSLAKEVCLTHNWLFQDLPPDKRISAWKGKNIHQGSLGLFIEKVKQGEIPKGSILIIEKLDRFSRNEVDLVLPLFIELLHQNILIYSCIDNTLYSTEEIRKTPRLLNDVVYGFISANDYSRSLSSRIKKGLEIKIEQIKQGKKVKLGGWLSSWFNQNEVNGTVIFEFNDNAKVVLQIVEEFLKGLSLRAICIKLNEQKIKLFYSKGKHWVSGSLTHILTNTQLYGCLKVNGLEFENYLPGLITKDQFNQIQNKLELNKNRRGGSKTDYVANLFRNRIRCKYCGGSICSAFVKTKLYYYKCLSHTYRKCDCSRQIRIKRFEESFCLNILFGNPNYYEVNQDKAIELELTKLQTDRNNINQKINQLLELNETIDLVNIKERLTNYKQQLEDIETRIHQLNQQTYNQSNIPKYTSQLIKLWKDNVGEDLFGNEFSKMLNNMETKLKDNEVRKQILNFVPNIINYIVMDLVNATFQVYDYNNKPMLKEDIHF